jgi:hypothetical protein
MSGIPAAIAGQIAGVAPVMNPIDALFAGINTSPYFTGLMMLLLNLGGRFLALEISKDQEKFLSQPYIRRFFLFAVLFVATRNVIIAACLAIVVILLLGYLFNENSDLCLWKSCATPAQAQQASQVQEGFQGLSPEEAMILKRLQDKQMAAAPKQVTEDELKNQASRLPIASEIYESALNKVRSLV